MEQSVRINVAKKEAKPGWDGKPTYRHHCAVHMDHLARVEDVAAMIGQLRLAFPEGEYQITATRWRLTGEILPVGDERP